MARIVNLRREPHAVADGAVRIDRRTPWGNPFRIGPGCSRRQVIARYRADLWRRIREGEIKLEALAALDGRDLACHCAPLPCHGEVLARAAVWAAATLRAREAERGGRGTNGAQRRGRPAAPPARNRRTP